MLHVVIHRTYNTSSRACNVQHYEKVWRKAVEVMADGGEVYAAKQ
jgi:hypothetical protein